MDKLINKNLTHGIHDMKMEGYAPRDNGGL
jgi:hypothetical protein